MSMEQAKSHVGELSNFCRRHTSPLREQPMAHLCFLLYWFWQIEILQDPGAFAEADVIGTIPIARVAILAAGAIAYLVMWLGYRKVNALAERRWCLPAATFGMFLGSLLFFCPLPMGASIHASLKVCGACLMGLGSSLFLVEMGRLFAQLGPYCALTAGAFGAAGGSLLYFISSSAPSLCEYIMLSLAPVAALVCLKRSRSRFPKNALFGHGMSSTLRFPWRYVITCLIHGLSLGTMAALLLKDDGANSSLICMAAYFTCFAVIAITTVVAKLDYSRLVYQVGFPLVGFSFLIYSFLSGTSEVSSFVFSVGYCFMYVIVSSVNTYFSNCLECPPMWIVALTTFFLLAGQSTSFVGVALCLERGLSAALVSCSLAFLMPVAALLLFDKKQLLSGWGAFSIVEKEASESELLLRRVSSRYGLSRREGQVCSLLFKGYNKKTISQELGVSEETVKTHIGKVYRKLMIHSQQELIRLIEDEDKAV